MKILVLDDDPFVRSLLQGALARHGHDVVSYARPGNCPLFTSSNCPCAMHDRCPDVVLTDVRMPGADGFDFVEEQRRKGCRCRRVALMSGAWTDADLARSKRMGLPFFAKPFHMEKVLNWIASADQDAKSNALAEAATAREPVLQANA